MEKYAFVDYPGAEYSANQSNDPAWYETTEKELQYILDTCEFVCTNYGYMYPTVDMIIEDGHRGPTLRHKDEVEFDWYYRIIGGYKKIK